MFTDTLQLFYLVVAYVLQWFSRVFQVFLLMFETHASSVSSVFRGMFQILHLNVSKVDRVFCTCCNLLQLLEGARGRAGHRHRAG